MNDRECHLPLCPNQHLTRRAHPLAAQSHFFLDQFDQLYELVTKKTFDRLLNKKEASDYVGNEIRYQF